MNNFDSISSISPISFTDIDNNNTITQSVLTSDTYKEIISEAQKINKKNLLMKGGNEFSVMEVNQGETNYLDTTNDISVISLDDITSTVDTQLINNTVSSTSSAFLTDLLEQDGGYRTKKVNADKVNLSTDSSSSSSSSDSESSSSSSSSEETNLKSQTTEEVTETTAGGKFISGTRYLYSDTMTETSYKINNKSFFDSDMSSTLATEDLTLLKN